MSGRITFKEIRSVLSLMAPPRIRTSGRRLPPGPFRDAAVAWYAAYEDFTDRVGERRPGPGSSPRLTHFSRSSRRGIGRGREQRAPARCARMAWGW